MKRGLLVFTILTFVSLSVLAQFGATISGKILDENTSEFIPYASIVVYDGDNLISGSISSEKDGSFQINGLGSGLYTLKVSFIGYSSYESKILIGSLNQYYDIGKVMLNPSTTELNEVNISGQTNELNSELSKKSYSMNNTIAQSGGSVMDAMKAMPGVTFSQEGKVVLRGSDKVIVLMDGKQSSLTGYGNQKGLDNIPAVNIDKIEIINNPSAKYDAAGMAGIINIVYKKDRQMGVHGSVGMAYGLGALTKPKADLPSELGSFSPTPKYIPSLDLNYKSEKLSAFIQTEILHQKKLPNNEFSTRYYDDGRVIASQVPENRKQTHYIAKGGFDYQFDDRNILSFSGIYDWESHIDSAQVPYIDLSTNTRNRYINWNEHEITGYMNFLLDYTHKFPQTGHEINAHLLYSKGWEDETYSINDSSSIRNNGRDITSVLGVEHTTSFNVDYTKPLLAGRIESGAKVQVRSLPVEYTQQRGENSILYPGLGSWTKWGESIYAGYINWVHEKINYSIEAGLRAEYTAVLYDMDTENIYYTQNDKYDYFKLFPNVRLSYKLNENNRLSIFYNQRIDRPGEPELRMYAKSDDHELVKVGNPYLRPQFTQSAEIGYKTNWTSGSLFISGYYRFITDPYMRVYTQDTSRSEYDVLLKSYANTGRAQNVGIELVFSQKVTDFYKLSGNFNLYQNKIESYTGRLLFPYEHTFNVPVTIDNTWDLKIINTLTLPKEFQVQLTGIYLAPKNIPQGKQMARSSVDLGVKKKLWDGKGEFNLVFADVFNKFGLEQQITGDGFVVDYENYYETQVLRAGLKYKF